MNIIPIKQGATPSFQKFLTQNNLAFPLTDCAVTFRWRKEKGNASNQPNIVCVIVDALNGEIRVDFTATDTNIDIGTYKGEYIVTNTVTSKITIFPLEDDLGTDDFETIIIKKSLLS